MIKLITGELRNHKIKDHFNPSEYFVLFLLSLPLLMVAIMYSDRDGGDLWLYLLPFFMFFAVFLFFDIKSYIHKIKKEVCNDHDELLKDKRFVDIIENNKLSSQLKESKVNSEINN